jgi:hypothetical protein
MTMTVIEHIELASSAASITFSDIPQTYTDLYLLVSARATTNDSVASLFVAVNASTSGDTGRILFGRGDTVGTGTNSSFIGHISGNTATSNTFGNSSAYFPNLTSSVAKSFSGDSVGEHNGTRAFQTISAQLSGQTSAITSLVLTVDSGQNFMQYSSATLYGILAGSDGTTAVS